MSKDPWGWRDPKTDPDAKENRERPQRKKKNTKKWCKGKVGVEHVTEIVADRRYENSHWRGCRSCKAWNSDRTWWLCCHIEVCVNCGKHVRWRIGMEECPVYLEMVTKP